MFLLKTIPVAYIIISRRLISNATTCFQINILTSVFLSFLKASIAFLSLRVESQINLQLIDKISLEFDFSSSLIYNTALNLFPCAQAAYL